LFSASIEKIAKRIRNGDFEATWISLIDEVPEAKERYLNVKDTMKPEKQKARADEYGALLLLKGYVGLKLGKLEAEGDLKELTIFFDPNSADQHLFKAYAWKLLSAVYESRGDSGQVEFCRKKKVEETENFAALGEESERKNMFNGILGSLD
jgi:hypothetical protein